MMCSGINDQGYPGFQIKDWRRGPDSNRWIKVLQTSALPLGYHAISMKSGKITLYIIFSTILERI